MFELLPNLLSKKAIAALVGMLVLNVQLGANVAIAEEPKAASGELLAQNFQELDSPTSVSQLADVEPTDWAYQALQSLIERYGILSAYPDGTFRGDRAMTRYEFAAGLNRALNYLSGAIASTTSNLLTREDLITLQRLQEEFGVELASLKGRVALLEGRTAELEANQFSTTTTLSGEAIFSLSGVTGGDYDISTVFQQRLRFLFNTSFTGEDILVILLQGGNAATYEFTEDTAEGLQTVQGFGDTDNELAYALAYTFPVSQKLKITFGSSLIYSYLVPTLNPYLETLSGGTGSLSIFGQRNAIYQLGGGSGISFNYYLTDSLELGGAYLTGAAANIEDGEGLFMGDHSFLGQLTWTPSPQFNLAFTYLKSYYKAGNFAFGDGSTISLMGTSIANTLNGLRDDLAVRANAYGIETFFHISPKVAMSGWVGFTDVNLVKSGDGEIWNYAVTLVFPDLGKEGSLGALIFGAQPTLRGLDVPGSKLENRDFAYHFEAFYKFQMNDNISITPGIFWLPSLNQDSKNDDLFIWVVRTTFSF